MLFVDFVNIADLRLELWRVSSDGDKLKVVFLRFFDVGLSLFWEIC